MSIVRIFTHHMRLGLSVMLALEGIFAIAITWLKVRRQSVFDDICHFEFSAVSLLFVRFVES